MILERISKKTDKKHAMEIPFTYDEYWNGVHTFLKDGIPLEETWPFLTFAQLELIERGIDRPFLTKLKARIKFGLRKLRLSLFINNNPLPFY